MNIKSFAWPVGAGVIGAGLGLGLSGDVEQGAPPEEIGGTILMTAAGAGFAAMIGGAYGRPTLGAVTGAAFVLATAIGANAIADD